MQCNHVLCSCAPGGGGSGGAGQRARAGSLAGLLFTCRAAEWPGRRPTAAAATAASRPISAPHPLTPTPTPSPTPTHPTPQEYLAVTPATKTYTAKLHARVPRVFVGTRAELLALVSSMATAAALSFTSQGLRLPPWRSRTALLARWAAPAVASTLLPSPSGLPLLPLPGLAPHAAMAAVPAAARNMVEGEGREAASEGAKWVGGESDVAVMLQQQQQLETVASPLNKSAAGVVPAARKAARVVVIGFDVFSAGPAPSWRAATAAAAPLGPVAPVLGQGLGQDAQLPSFGRASSESAASDSSHSTASSEGGKAVLLGLSPVSMFYDGPSATAMRSASVAGGGVGIKRMMAAA